MLNQIAYFSNHRVPRQTTEMGTLYPILTPYEDILCWCFILAVTCIQHFCKWSVYLVKITDTGLPPPSDGMANLLKKKKKRLQSSIIFCPHWHRNTKQWFRFFKNKLVDKVMKNLKNLINHLWAMIKNMPQGSKWPIASLKVKGYLSLAVQRFRPLSLRYVCFSTTVLCIAAAAAAFDKGLTCNISATFPHYFKNRVSTVFEQALGP